MISLHEPTLIGNEKYLNDCIKLIGYLPQENI